MVGALQEHVALGRVVPEVAEAAAVAGRALHHPEVVPGEPLGVQNQDG